VGINNLTFAPFADATTLLLENSVDALNGVQVRD
jgi:hypothetical protein